MSESCTCFNPHHWKPNTCRDCNKKREDHVNDTISNGSETSYVHLSTLHQIDNEDNDLENQSDMLESRLVSSMQESAETILPLCRYGIDCYRRNPEHFERYSHPLEHERHKNKSKPVDATASPIAFDDERTASTTTAAGRRSKITSKEKYKELQEIDQMERYIHTLHSSLKSKDQEIDELRQDQLEMKGYNQNLEQVIREEFELRERRELEQQRVLAVPQQTPSYWGPNAFSESYREIQISNESPEFRLINDLMNLTITTHDNNYGTIYGQDPTEFIVTNIKRIQNKRLWDEYCCKKVR